MEEIAGTIQIDLNLRAEPSAHDILANRLKDEVSVLGVAKAPKSNSGILGEKFIHSAQTDELRKSTLTGSTET